VPGYYPEIGLAASIIGVAAVARTIRRISCAVGDFDPAFVDLHRALAGRLVGHDDRLPGRLEHVPALWEAGAVEPHDRILNDQARVLDRAREAVKSPRPAERQQKAARPQ
jgi:hypothetical protein